MMMIKILLLKVLTNKHIKGFTMIELLVVMLIVAVFGSIALPNTMAVVGKAKEAEAKQMLSSLGETQQAYYLENAKFADKLENLDIVFSGYYYNYEEPVIITNSPYPGVKQGAIAVNSLENNTREYKLGVYYNSKSFLLVLCQSLSPNQNAQAPNISDGECINSTKVQ
ncbi:type IV pilin protein [Crocosphaera watsonii WH 8501]|nr:type IV pilin-like G/H family protein [Crocosphaera watsonii]